MCVERRKSRCVAATAGTLRARTEPSGHVDLLTQHATPSSLTTTSLSVSSPFPTMATTVLISTFPPFPTLAFSAPSDTTLDDLYDSLSNRYPFLPSSDDLFLSPLSGALPHGSTTLASLHASSEQDDSSSLVSLRLAPRMLGGKGGFGSQLRAAGGRMSSQKTSNNDSCRDLSGRRLSTIKEAKKWGVYAYSH